MIDTTDPEAMVQEFDRHRQVLFGLAYRMLGSAMDAEDIVQEAFLRWHQAARDEVQSPRAFLMTIVTRLCLDQLRSARARRESYIGTWLPEPLVHSGGNDPIADVEQADTLSFAFLLLLERLTPLERAVFILHDIISYTYDEIAQIVGSNGPHCRQLGHRARARVSSGRPRFRVSAEQVEQATNAFIRASTEGDLQGLLALFTSDITLWTDGGGKVVAARNVVYGADRVARLLIGIMRKRTDDYTHKQVLVNGTPGLAVWLNNRLNRIYTLELDTNGRIQAIYCVMNPDKLRSAAEDGKGTIPRGQHGQ